MTGVYRESYCFLDSKVAYLISKVCKANLNRIEAIA